MGAFGICILAAGMEQYQNQELTIGVKSFTKTRQEMFDIMRNLRKQGWKVMSFWGNCHCSWMLMRKGFQKL